MQTERAPQHTPQEIHVVTLVPEQAIPAMQQALIAMLHELPTPITINIHKDPKHQTTYYTYQVGEQTEQHPPNAERTSRHTCEQGSGSWGDTVNKKKNKRSNNNAQRHKKKGKRDNH